MQTRGERGGTLSRDIAALALAPGARPGWAAPSFISQPFFHKALAILFAYGCTLGGLMYLYNTRRISYDTKDLHMISSYLLFFAGGMHIAGTLTPKRFLLIAANAAATVAWNYYFYSAPYYNLLSILIVDGLVFWWVWKRPDIAADFGFRKSRFSGDIITGAAMAAAFTIYFIILLRLFGYPLKFEPSHIAAHASTTMGLNSLAIGFVYLIWKKMRDMGISRIGGIAVLALMISVMEVPCFAGYYAAGIVGIERAVMGFLVFSVAFAMVMSLTFNKYRNVLPAIFLITAAQECLVMMGVLS